jgi:Uma2 family endonuclease
VELYRANGARLGWLLIPKQQAVEIWSADAPAPQSLAPAQLLDAEAFLPCLRIALGDVLWQLKPDY